jgi:hypothetical protein
MTCSARHWHWDNPCELHLDHPKALFVVSFIGPVAPGGGGTLILSGSPRLLIQRERGIPASQRHGSIAMLRERFHNSGPWLMTLTGQAPSPADRTAVFMDRETTVDGVPLHVVELTGEPGDMVFCHPVMVHCVAPNRGTRPRSRLPRRGCAGSPRAGPWRESRCWTRAKWLLRMAERPPA